MKLKEAKFIPYGQEGTFVLGKFESREINGGYVLEFHFVSPDFQATTSVTKFWTRQASKEYAQQFFLDIGIPKENGEWVLEDDKIIGLAVKGVLEKEEYFSGGEKKFNNSLRVIEKLPRLELVKALELFKEYSSDDKKSAKNSNNDEDDLPF